MSNRRSIILMLLAIAALSVANFCVSWTGPDARKSRQMLLDAAFPAPERVTVSRPRAEPLTLVREAGWRFIAPFRGNADEAAVMRMLDAVAAATVQDSLTDDDLNRIGTDRGNFGLVPPRLRLELAAAGGTVAFGFGRRTPTGDGIYVAIEGERQIYVVSTNVLGKIDLTAKDFRPRKAVELPPSEVASFDLKRGTGQLMRFVKGDDGWRMTQPREARAGTERVMQLLESVTSATVVDWVWPRGGTNEAQIASSSLLAGYGLDPDSTLTVTMKDAKGADVRMSLGDLADKGTVYALLPGASAIVTVDAALKELAVGESAYFTDLRLFPIDRKLVESISIVDGKVSCLMKLKDNGSWAMESPVEAPVDEVAMEALLKRMLAMGPSDVATNGVTVSVSTNLPPAKVSRQALLGEGGLEDLRSRRILKVDPKVVKRLVVTDRGETPVAAAYDRETKRWAIELAASKDGTAAEPKAVEMDDEALDAIVAAMNPLTAVGISKLKPASARLGEYGLDDPVRTIAVDSVGETAVRRTILLGAETGDGGRYATVGAADAVFVLPAETLEILMRPIARP